MRNICMPFAFAGFLMITITSDSRTSAVGANSGRFSYDSYATTLKKYVDDTGMVNYAGLNTDPAKLKAFVDSMGRLDPNVYDRWNEKEQIAFWLNVYNGLTLKVIIDNYPIKPSFFRSRVYPKNSIRQIAGVWDKITFRVMGRDLTLGHIEHEVLRRKFDEPRIHMAMVCAAMSCPPLRNEPYTAQKLGQQLDDQSTKFLTNSKNFRIDRSKALLYLSPILKWFDSDFVNKYAPRENIGMHNRETSAVLNFIAGYLPPSERDFVLKGNFKINYSKYDWSLNEQERPAARKNQNEP
ncbi:MAG TPA: DUF547 domain-containing protein [Sedimentisphaerales bacterium]|nr:DUF547 domain-containing protein [Sedimentisphaerales bacterium]